MKSKAFDLFNEAWAKLVGGDLYNEQNNTQIEYMIKSLWHSEYHNQIKQTILKDLSHLLTQSQTSTHPPQFLHTIISLNDNQISIKLQELAIIDWIQSNSSEPTTFHLLNLIESFSEKKTNINNFIRTIIKNMKPNMDIEMLKAFSYMIYAKQPNFLEAILKQFASFPDKSILKDFVKAIGKKAVLLLATFMRPGDINKFLK